ncbi:MAG: AsmA family protein [Candidatus Omnitrophota bacterium]
MKNTIFAILFVLALAIFGGIFYLNEIFIPANLKRTVTEGIETATGKKVLLESLKFSVLKGMVLKGFVLYDDKDVILKAKEISCTFFIIPFLKKEIIIPVIKIRSPVILLERRPDNSINLSDLFDRKDVPKYDYNVMVRSIRMTGGKVIFIDDTLAPPYAKDIDKVNVRIYLSPPSKALFDLDFEIPSETAVKVDSTGEYDISSGKGSAKIAVTDLSLKEFAGYYESTGMAFPGGTSDAIIDLDMDRDIISAGMNVQTKDLAIFGGGASARLSSYIKADLRYSLNDRRLGYAGTMKIDKLAVSGVEYFQDADEIEGDLSFSDSGFSSNNISAKIFGIPVGAKVNLAKLEAALLDIDIIADVKLDLLEAILKERFEMNIPARLEGDGRLYITMQYKIPVVAPPEVRGSLETSDASIIIEEGKPRIEKVRGILQFGANQFTWSGIDLMYLGTPYRTSGTLTNPDAPGVQLKLSSKDLSLESVFSVNGRQMTFGKFEGSYLNSNFSLKGKAVLASPSAINADIKGALDVRIGDMKTALKDLRDKLERMRAAGSFHADLNLKGNMKDIRSCAIEAKVMSSSVSLYGLKPASIVIDYYQKDGVVDMPRIHSFLYGGTLDADARIDLVSRGNPYSVNVEIKNVKLEKLKEDIGMRDKDISGSVWFRAKLNGLSDDPATLNGAGNISVDDGKLWQLNLFRGLGVLIFTSDFSEVIFKKASASLVFRDKAVSTDGMWLTSDLINMYGSARIGFDNSIKASLKAEIAQDALESGARKNITTAMGRYTMIDVVGTLKEPKYRLTPDIGGILGDIKGFVFE